MCYHRFPISDTNALRTSDCEIPNCRAILDGVTPPLKAARTTFNVPCVKGMGATTATRCLREISTERFLPRRFCSATTADNNWSSSWSLSLACMNLNGGCKIRAVLSTCFPTMKERRRVRLSLPTVTITSCRSRIHLDSSKPEPYGRYEHLVW